MMVWPLSEKRISDSILWRKDDPEIDNSDSGRGPVVSTGGMFQHQREWWEGSSFIKVLVTGYGGGKTLIAGKRAIAMCLHNAPIPVGCVSPSYKVARRTIIPTIKALLEGKKTILPQLNYRYNKSEFEFVISYLGKRGVIWVLSGDQPEALKGPNLCAAYIDEPFIQDREVFNQILARVRDPSSRKLEIGITGTPEELNWGYDICVGENRDDYDLSLIQASTRANLALSPEYANRLEKGYSDRAARAFVDGQFVNLAEGVVYYAFSQDRNVIAISDPGHEMHVGMDFNVDPMAFIVFWINGKRMHVVKEYELPNSDTEDAANVLRNDWGSRLRNVYPDASGKSRSTKAPAGRSDFHLLQQAGFIIKARSANPPVRDRYNAVNGKFRSRQQDIPELTISPDCKKLIRYCLEYTHESKHRKKHMSHLLDALGYPVEYLFPIRKGMAKVLIRGF